MKKTEKLMSLCSIFTIISFSFACCNNDNEHIPGGDLSIESNVPLTRATGETIWETDYNKIPNAENECCLVALVEVKQQSMENHTFTSEYTAEEYYYRVKDYACSLKDENDKPLYSGGEMDLEVFLNVGQKFNLINDRHNLSSDSEREKYFNIKKKTPKIIHINVPDPKTGEPMSHVAKVNSVDYKRSLITYSTPDGPTTIALSEVLDAWD